MRNSYHTKKKPCMNKSIWVFVSLIASVRGGRQTLSSLRGGENKRSSGGMAAYAGAIDLEICLVDVQTQKSLRHIGYLINDVALNTETSSLDVNDATFVLILAISSDITTFA